MNGDFKIIFDRLEKFDDQNREEHQAIMEKMDEWNKILREQPQVCARRFAGWRIVWLMFLLVGGSYSFTAVVLGYVMKHLGG